MVTLRDVANAAGVSPAAASYALSGSSKVTEETARRVRRAARTLHYTGNFAARSLRRGKSGIIGVAMFELRREYPATLAYAIGNEVAKHGRQALVQQISYSDERERAFIRSMANQYSDGLLLCSAGVPESEIDALSKGKPVVVLDDVSIKRYDTVLNPREEGENALVGHLVSIGRTDALIIGADRLSRKEIVAAQPGRYRFLASCYAAYANHGMRLNKRRIEPLPAWDIEQARLKAHELVERRCIFDSAICSTDTVALGFIRGLLECGVRVPDDVAVVGFDGIATGRYCSPTLTTIETDIDEVARRAVDLLMRRIGDAEDNDDDESAPTDPQHVTVGYRLRIGESTVGAKD